VKPFLLVLSAPSGGGKSSIARNLLQGRNDLGYSVSATTRPMRDGERNGVDYYFIDRKEFVRRLEAGAVPLFAFERGDIGVPGRTAPHLREREVRRRPLEFLDRIIAELEQRFDVLALVALVEARQSLRQFRIGAFDVALGPRQRLQGVAARVFGRQKLPHRLLDGFRAGAPFPGAGIERLAGGRQDRAKRHGLGRLVVFRVFQDMLKIGAADETLDFFRPVGRRSLRFFRRVGVCIGLWVHHYSP